MFCYDLYPHFLPDIRETEVAGTLRCCGSHFEIYVELLGVRKDTTVSCFATSERISHGYTEIHTLLSVLAFIISIYEDSTY
jgi:hypothetical protein